MQSYLESSLLRFARNDAPIHRIVIMERYYVYIMTNVHNQVLYVGMTNDLAERMIKHRAEVDPKSFVVRYHVFKLVYVEEYMSVTDAIAREKQLKGGSREKKIQLIKSANPSWEELMP